jgi:hypothetical protein
MNGIEMLENRIAGAQSAEESRLFADASALFRTDPDIARCCKAQAFADAAIRLHRALLPANGYQLGETAARRGLASSWRPGDAHALPFEAATPALALLRATAHALARQHFVHHAADAAGRSRATAVGAFAATRPMRPSNLVARNTARFACLAAPALVCEPRFRYWRSIRVAR